METLVNHKLLLALSCCAPLLTACGGSDDTPPPEPPAAPPAPVALTCQQMAGMTIPAASIGLPTTGGTVTEALVVAAAGTGAAAIPEYCRVTGTIAPVDPAAPNITFRVALPTSWNSKVVMFGGGGF